MSDFKATSESIAGAPSIEFYFKGDTFRAVLHGAQVYGEADSNGARVRLTDVIGEVLADITIHDRSHRNMTENVIDVCSALLWSHWRHATAGDVYER